MNTQEIRASAEVTHIRPKHKLYTQHTRNYIQQRRRYQQWMKKTSKKQCVSAIQKKKATSPVPFASSNANQFERNEKNLAYMAAKYTRLLLEFFFFQFLWCCSQLQIALRFFFFCFQIPQVGRLGRIPALTSIKRRLSYLGCSIFAKVLLQVVT